MKSEVTIYLVDDEREVTEATSWLLSTVGLRATCLDSPRSFVEAIYKNEGPVCAILDLRMPEMGGLEILENLCRKRPDVPVVFLSAHGDVTTAVRGMKLGAFDFLKKPCHSDVFLDCVNRLIREARDRHLQREERRNVDQRVARLSQREREVLEFLLEGASSKEIGRALLISPKTVDIHRANLMKKMDVSSLRALFREMRRLPRHE